MRTNIVSLFLLTAISAYTTSSFAEPYTKRFSDSLQRRGLIRTARLEAIAASTLLAKQSLIEQWGWVPAGASYNDTINTVSLPKEHVVRKDDSRWLRLPTPGEFARSTGMMNNYVPGQTFHELSHAEEDVIIEEAKSGIDADLKALFIKMAPWVKENFPKLSKRESRLAVSEFFGYYRGDMLTNFMNLRNDLLFDNWVREKNDKVTCHIPPRFRTQTYTEENIELLVNKRGANIPWIYEFSTVFVGGEDVDFAKPLHGELPAAWIDQIWQHAIATYGFPKTTDELVARLNQDKRLRKLLRECRTNGEASIPSLD